MKATILYRLTHIHFTDDELDLLAERIGAEYGAEVEYSKVGTFDVMFHADVETDEVQPLAQARLRRVCRGAILDLVPELSRLEWMGDP